MACAAFAGVAAAEPVQLLPGVTYERQATLTPRGPVVLNVITAPRPGGLLTLEPVLSNDAVPGAETLTSIQKRLSATATSIGVAGDFATKEGRPLGLVLRNGALQHAPLSTRSSAGIDATGTLRADRLRLLGTWQGAGPRRLLSAVNESPTANQLTVFTPAWGPTTPAVNGTVEIVIQPFPAAAPGGELTGTVTTVAFGGGSVIPPDGVVLVARGSSATNANREAQVGQQVKLRLILRPDWAGVLNGIGGGPQLVKGGVAIYRPADGFTRAALLARGPRSAVGQRQDGTLLLVTVDGGRPGTSVGMTSFELAQAMVRLGAVTAVGLVDGPSATMGFNGTLLSRPHPAETPISTALLLVYRGVYVPQTAPVLSPNGDGANDVIALSYKAVRQSEVTATLTGPDGQAVLGDAGQRAPQSYAFSWAGVGAGGAPAPEGLYRWVVAATDDQGVRSSMERTFVLNRTLGRLRATAVLRTSRAIAQPVAAYELTRQARVAVTILSPAGVLVARLPVQSLAAGAQVVAWDGRDVNGGAVAPGRYTVRVTADNDLGGVSQTTALVVRRA